MENFDYVLRDYLLYLTVEKGLAENTIENYQRDLEQFGQWLKEHQESLETMDQLTVRRYQGYLGEHYQASSMARKITALKGFVTYLTDNGLIEQAMTVTDRSKKIEKLPEVLTIAQMNAMIDAIPRDKLSGKRDAAMLELMYATGIRVSEVIELRMDQYYAEEQFIRVMGKGHKERLVPFGECARHSVADYLAARQASHVAPSPYLFLSNRQAPMTRQAVWKMVKKYAKIVNIPFEVTPHTIRHTFATHLLNNGVDLRAIQEMLGHSDISTTQIYVHVAFDDIENQYHLLHPRSHENLKESDDSYDALSKND